MLPMRTSLCHTQRQPVSRYRGRRGRCTSGWRWMRSARQRDLAPDEPWIWFQIGFWSVALEGRCQDVEGAREALEHVLKLDPANDPAHCAMAYLTLRHGPYADDGLVQRLGAAEAERDDILAAVLQWWIDADLKGAVRPDIFPESLQQDYLHHDEEAKALRAEWEAKSQAILWDGPTGLHLRAVSDSTGGIRGLPFGHSARIAGTDLVLDYFPNDLASGLVFSQLDALGEEVLPEVLRAEYYNELGLSFEDFGDGYRLGLPWFKKAVQWDAGDADALQAAFCHLGIGLLETESPDYLAACDAFEQSYRHLMRMADPSSDFWYWIDPVKGCLDAWQPRDDLPRFLGLCDLALDLSPFGRKPLDKDIGDSLAAVAETAAKQLLERCDLPGAERYLRQSCELDPTRTSAVRLLAELYFGPERWSQALAEYRRITEQDPKDRRAHLLVLLLEEMVEKTHGREAFERILGEFAQLRAGQELILDELVTQRDMLQRVADAQRRVRDAIERPGGAERAYEEFAAQLHSLIQEGSRIQPAAWRVAEQRLIAELGEETIDRLSHDGRHFLITAEAFHAASRDVAALADAAVIAVEYAKVLEVELSTRLMPALARHLDDKHYAGRLYASNEIRRGGDGWGGALSKQGIGTIGAMIDRAAAGDDDNRIVTQYFSGLGFDQAWIAKLADRSTDGGKTLPERRRAYPWHGSGHGRRVPSDAPRRATRTPD